jgi:hypothetical protein
MLIDCESRACAQCRARDSPENKDTVVLQISNKLKAAFTGTPWASGGIAEIVIL